MTAGGNELQGTGVSLGIAVGPALIVERDGAPTFRLPLAAEQVVASRLFRKIELAAEIEDTELLEVLHGRMISAPGRGRRRDQARTRSEPSSTQWARTRRMR